MAGGRTGLLVGVAGLVTRYRRLCNVQVIRNSVIGVGRMGQLHGGLCTLGRRRGVMFMRNVKGQGARLRGDVRALRSCLRHLGKCAGGLRVYKGEGDCSGASPSTAFVQVGRSTVKGKRLGPTFGLRRKISSRCVM